MKRNWFFAGVVVVTGMAFGLPGLGGWVREHYILNAGIFLVFLITGMTLETSGIKDQLRRLKAPLLAMISSLVLIPMLGWLMAFLTLPTEFLVGVCIVAVAPVTLASGTVMTEIGRGNVPLSIFICVLGNTLAVFTLPFSLNVLLGMGHSIELPIKQMLGGLTLMILLPSFLGQLLRPHLKQLIAIRRKGFSIFQQCVVLLIIFNAIVSCTDRILEAGSSVLYVLLFVALLHSVVLLMNYSISKIINLDRPSTTAFTIHTSQKTLAVSYFVWAGYFATQFPMALIPAIGYHLTQMIIDTVVAQRFGLLAELDARHRAAKG